MKILIIAPQPFYQERGTPIAVHLLTKTLSDLGHNIDLLVYHEGMDIPCPDNVKIHRIPKPDSVGNIGPGLSLDKLRCDRVMLSMALSMAANNKYDLVHAVEEGVFIAMRIKKQFGTRYIYDMDSSMSQQIIEKLPWMKIFSGVMGSFETAAIKQAELVVSVCDSLADIAKSAGAKRVEILRDVSLLNCKVLPAETTKAESPSLRIRGVCLMYVGNLEEYQGIDLMLESLAIAMKKGTKATLVIVGGTPAHIDKYTKKATELGIVENVQFIGPKPTSMMAHLFEVADVLLSPRIKGINTPMKIYSYLESGKAVLATKMPTHTQVLNDSVAMLCAPDSSSFAEGIHKLCTDHALRQQLGSSARALANKEYTYEAFAKNVKRIFGSWK